MGHEADVWGLLGHDDHASGWQDRPGREAAHCLGPLVGQGAELGRRVPQVPAQ